MSAIQLIKPAANATQNVTCESGAEFVFGFATGDVVLSKSESGDHLVMTFDDGARLVLENFYGVYNAENMPAFVINGTSVPGGDFFGMMDHTLSPAAGPTASAAALARGGRDRSFGDMDFFGGINRLSGLDIGFAEAARQDETPFAAYTLPDSDPVTVSPAMGEAGTPPAPPSSSSFVVLNLDNPVVYESGLAGGTAEGSGSNATSGSISIGAGNGIAVIVINGQVVWRDGELVSDTVDTGLGELSISSYDPSTHTLSYIYTLTNNDTSGGNVTDGITITATDTSGTTGTGTLPVTVIDDTPEAQPDTNSVAASDTLADLTITGDVYLGLRNGETVASMADKIGADGFKGGGQAVEWGTVSLPGGTVTDGAGTYSTAYGMLTLNNDGTYSFTLKDSAALAGLAAKGVLNVPYTITDGDGSTASASLTIDIAALLARNDDLTRPIMNTVTGNIFANDLNIAALAGNSALPGQYGTATLGADGSFAYTLNATAMEAALGAVGNDPRLLQGETFTYAGKSDGLTSNTATVVVDRDDLAAGVTLAGETTDDVAWVKDNHGTLQTAAGNDLIVVDTNKTGGTIDAGDGADAVYLGTNEADSSVYGGAGNDTITIANGTNEGKLYGDEGSDTFEVKENAAGGLIDGGAGGDTITVAANYGTIRGGDGAERDWIVVEGGSGGLVEGKGGPDLINMKGNTSNSTVDGGAGNDALAAYDSASGNIFYGGTGVDRLVAHDSASGSIFYSGTGEEVEHLSAMDSATGNTFYSGNKENDPADTVGDSMYAFGKAKGNHFYGAAGKDTLTATNHATGNDFHGGAGIDSMVAWEHASGNIFYGGTEGDQLIARGSAQCNTFLGEEGGDTLLASDIAIGNTFDGGAGGDLLEAEDSARENILKGGAGGDTLYAWGNATGNTFYAGDSVNDAADTAGNELHAYGGNGNHFYGAAGDDRLEASCIDTVVAWNNDFHGGDGKDTLQVRYSATGNTLYGDAGKDELFASDDASKNILDGGTGDDTLYVHNRSTANTLKGGEDNDWLSAMGQAQGNSLDGGTGNDTLYAREFATGNTLKGGEGDFADTLMVDGTNPSFWGSKYNVTGNKLYGEGGNDLLIAQGNASANELYGDAGSDTLIVSDAAKDTVRAPWGGRLPPIGDGHEECAQRRRGQ